MLITSAGRTFCVKPKSASQTSPRSGRRILLFVERTERRSGEHAKILVCQIIGYRQPLNNRAAQLSLLRFTELTDFFKDMSDTACVMFEK